MPDKIKHPIRPTPQDEYHTCGFCAVNSLYNYYGLDPEERLIRDYLGTDHILPANIPFRDKIEKWLGGTDHLLSGTSPMDILAVLYWDGFDTQIRTGRYSTHADELQTHLLNGDTAIAMVYGCFHWVVISGFTEQGVWVVDGHFTAKDVVDGSRSSSHNYLVPHDLFEEELHALILVSRDDFEEHEMREMRTTDFIREYARGIGFCCQILGRKIPPAVRRLIPERGI